MEATTRPEQGERRRRKKEERGWFGLGARGRRLQGFKLGAGQEAVIDYGGLPRYSLEFGAAVEQL
jgi:hypothetical protein